MARWYVMTDEYLQQHDSLSRALAGPRIAVEHMSADEGRRIEAPSTIYTSGVRVVETPQGEYWIVRADIVERAGYRPNQTVNELEFTERIMNEAKRSV